MFCGFDIGPTDKPKDVALKYARAGIKIFPAFSIENGKCSCRRDLCRSPGKHPIIKDWKESATAEQGIVSEFWTKYPNANIGLATGPTNGLFVLDIDPKNGGVDSLKNLLEEIPEIEKTLTVKTGSGGFHFYFQSNSEEIKNSTGVYPGIDVRGAGGFVIAPKSTHATGNHYVFLNPGISLSEPPVRLVALISQKKPKNRAAEISTNLQPTASSGDYVNEGGRNDYLFRQACSLRSRGAEGPEILKSLTLLNMQKVNPPLEQDELNSICASALTYEPTVFGRVHIDSGRYCLRAMRDDEETLAPLCNFTAKITTVLQHVDAGGGISTSFEISVIDERGADLGKCVVSAEEFPLMNWVIKNYGNKARITYVRGAKDYIRSTIQQASGDPKVQKVFSGIGWTSLNGKNHFLHSGGAIPSLPESVSIRPEQSAMELYELKLTSSKEEAIQCVRTSLDFGKISPHGLGSLLISAAFSAPLIEGAINGDFTISIIGASGTRKSSCVATAMGHFGSRFNRVNLPSWFSTANQIEKCLYLCGHALYVLDDFAPNGSSYDVALLNGKAERVIRSIGNRSSRGRMRSDGSLQTEYHPRCLLVITGEDIPKGHSLKARQIVYEVQQDEVDLKILSEYQEHSRNGTLSKAMGHYIANLAKSSSEFREYTSTILNEARVYYEKRLSSTHPRAPESLAQLFVGAKLYIKFANDIGAISLEQAAELELKYKLDLEKIGEAQQNVTEDESPAQKFLSLLQSAVASGYCHIADHHLGSYPESWQRWGWRAGGKIPEPRGEKVGWINKAANELIFDAGTVYRVVSKYAREHGDHLENSKGVILKRLSEARFILRPDDKNTLKRKVEGVRRNCIVMPLSVYEPS